MWPFYCTKVYEKLILGLVCTKVTTQVFSIGHSNRQWDEFANLLKDNKIVTVVDVRRYPGSKSFPHFNKEILARELFANNILYKHIEKLGGRRNKIAMPLEYDNRGWQNKSFRSYANYMLTRLFKEGIEELLSLITKRNDGSLAIMCSEAVPWRCHRRLISDYLLMVKGINVYDIIGNSNRCPSPHVITPFARHNIDENIVIYPKS
jgi:uncharacterized protein (DUF488 family)